MTDAEHSDYWGRQGLRWKIVEVLSATYDDIDNLTIQDLAPLDQFHGGAWRRRSGWPGSQGLQRGRACSTLEKD